MLAAASSWRPEPDARAGARLPRVNEDDTRRDPDTPRDEERTEPAPMVMLVRAVCLKCGEAPRGINGPNGEDWRFPALVPAEWLHSTGARRPHSFACDGQIQLEAAPPPAGHT